MSRQQLREAVVGALRQREALKLLGDMHGVVDLHRQEAVEGGVGVKNDLN